MAAKSTNPARDRAMEVRKERRNRDGATLDRMSMNKLALPPEFRQYTNDWTFRWVNDDGTRIHDLTTEGEWDVCTTPNPESSDEQQVRKTVGTKPNGEPLYAYLLREPKWIFDEDQARKGQQIADAETASLQGQHPDQEPDDKVYAKPGNTVTRGYAPSKPQAEESA